MKVNDKISKRDQELIDKINKAITDLVYEKTKIRKAYNYYHGKRDPEQFKHLEENYGIGTPTSIEFVPLVKKHIDVLVGEYLSIPFKPKVTCKDKSTISKINQEKLVNLSKEISKSINNHLRNIIDGKYSEVPRIQEELEEIKLNFENNFISEYEIASQNIIE